MCRLSSYTTKWSLFVFAWQSTHYEYGIINGIMKAFPMSAGTHHPYCYVLSPGGHRLRWWHNNNEPKEQRRRNWNGKVREKKPTTKTIKHYNPFVIHKWPLRLKCGKSAFNIHTNTALFMRT